MQGQRTICCAGMLAADNYLVHHKPANERFLGTAKAALNVLPVHCFHSAQKMHVCRRVLYWFVEMMQLV